MRHEWKNVDALPPLEQDEIQIWRLDLSSDPSLLVDYSHHLSGEEQARAARRLAGRVRAEFVMGRVCLRILLANTVGISPLDIRFKENPYGKPELAMEGPVPSFNVSHSNGTIFIGIAKHGNIGIDIEHIDSSIDISALAPSVCSAGELVQLASLATEESRRLFFYRCWSRKEAIIKADGRGLSIPLTEFAVPAEMNANPEIVALQYSAKSYFLSEIECSRHVVGAIATDSPNCRIRQLYFPLSVLKVLPVQK